MTPEQTKQMLKNQALNEIRKVLKRYDFMDEMIHKEDNYDEIKRIVKDLEEKLTDLTNKSSVCPRTQKKIIAKTVKGAVSASSS